MLTRAPGAVRPETTNWLGTVAPFAGRTFVISPTTAAEVPDVKFQPRLNCPPLASVPVTRTRCVPAWSGARGAYEKPRGERVDALVTSVSSRNTRIVFGSTTPPAKVASIVGRRDEMDAPRAGTSFASVIAPLLAPPLGALGRRRVQIERVAVQLDGDGSGRGRGDRDQRCEECGRAERGEGSRGG